MVVTGRQRNDGVMLKDTLEDIYVPRPTGRPRTTPEVVLADRGYTSGVNRRYLRARHIKMVIPQKKNEIAARQKKGSHGPTLFFRTPDVAGPRGPAGRCCHEHRE